MVENECIFDKFSLGASPDSNTISTGNYNNCFHLIDVDGANTQYELSYKKATVSKSIVPGKGAALSKMDYERKTIAVDFHPKKNMVAVGSLNCFFMYSM
jgi:serine/threonine-protein phosphatase 2A regulatory subunit B